MSIDKDGATEYFKQHIRGVVWSNFDQQHEAAVEHAKRVLARALGRAINDDESAYEEGDSVREEYAVYEQALWLLENGTIANGESSAPAFISTDPERPDNARDSQKNLIAPEAMRWLGVRGHGLVLMRG